MLLRVTGKDVKDLHQIKTHQFLSRELIYRLQQGRLYSCDFEKKNDIHILVYQTQIQILKKCC